MNSTFIEIAADKFHEFITENLPKHQTSINLVNEFAYQRFHSMNSYKKDFINEILNTYYGIHYVGIATTNDQSLKYKLSVTDKNLCTFFLLKYGA
jgi:hypothetical protein